MNCRSLLAVIVVASFVLPLNAQGILDQGLSPAPSANNYFYSEAGREHEVAFQAWFRSDFQRLEDVAALSPEQRAIFATSTVGRLMDFLFGPLVTRSLGSPQMVETVNVKWEGARLANGRVELPYSYQAIWILSREAAEAGVFQIPVPMNRALVFTPRWKQCGDREPEHQTPGFYWYFWDPARPGCDQHEGVNFRTVEIHVGRGTPNTITTFPEYGRMIANGHMNMTFAFGYIEDRNIQTPDTDQDGGAWEYQKFISSFRRTWGTSMTETPIYQGEYKAATRPNLVIGHRYQGTLNGIAVTVNVMMSAGIDQIDLFAKSFAHDHDALFAWFGHSRVGSGFDAERFQAIVRADPGYYSMSNDYQIIYWGGCNSYSYYTLPFFSWKGGSRNLDIIANGLPSLFSFNADNALITANQFLNWPARMSYQSLVRQLETRANNGGTRVLVAVLGDEDNSR